MDARTAGKLKTAVRVIVRASDLAPRGELWVTADYGHPEVPMPTPIWAADALIVICHPDDHLRIERTVRLLRGEGLVP